ncbi:MAG: TerY-C metal binding domain-containing protein [Gammaproteobacteria bacterium]
MRRLPLFFLLDVSESMLGDELRKMEEGLSSIVRSLRRDPHALETVYLSVIAFAGVARTIAPLVDLVSFYPPKLPIGSGTSLGAALNQLMVEIDRSVVKTTADRKGDWKPIVYLFTDGKPTDAVDPAIERWNRDYARKTDLVAVALGRYADLSVLQRLTEHVLVFEDAGEGDFSKFIQWITASVTMQSKGVGEGRSEGLSLAKLDDSVLAVVKDAQLPAKGAADKDCVVLAGRCQKTRKPYLIKYDRVSQTVATNDFKLDTSYYQLTVCCPVDDAYFEWSDKTASDLKANTSELAGVPGCPYCGNPSAFARCGCGGLLCVLGPGMATCPWCEQQVRFEAGAGEEGFDVRRGRG